MKPTVVGAAATVVEGRIPLRRRKREKTSTVFEGSIM